VTVESQRIPLHLSVIFGIECGNCPGIHELEVL
jgi:hypothetical protein